MARVSSAPPYGTTGGSGSGRSLRALEHDGKVERRYERLKDGMVFGCGRRDMQRRRGEVVAALMTAVIVPAAARLIRMMMRSAVVAAGMRMAGRSRRVRPVLDAIQRVQHCRKSLHWDQQHEREEHVPFESHGHEA